ncbi:MAG: hypothetical protein SPL15_00090 [Lachnospiraceae bacterium]|nr:hypothetical protein [Lachnospiraceae bacterium]MDY5741387.1 hypothetical protein [Lachnospiraceae bacterium]
MEHKKIEALWNCSYCSAEGIGGSLRECPGCGRPRGRDVRFYLPSDPSQYKEADSAKTDIGEQPDWMCAYCAAYNHAAAEYCKGCGSPRTESKESYRSIQTANRQEKNSQNHPDGEGDFYDTF